MFVNITLFLLGLVVLVIGAECLIRGAVRIARALGVSPFVIGFTLIGFGTSAPELVVSLSAALNNSPELALGNVVGSNIANVGVILGIAALVRPLAAQMRLLTIEVPVVIFVSALLWCLCRDNVLDRFDGAVLLAAFLAVAISMYRSSHEEPPEVKKEVGLAAATHMRVWVAAVLVIVGMAGLIGGAHLMVTAAVAMAKAFGVSEWLIGLTIVAVGTSLPEVAATVAAAYRGEADIALGNVVGSNLFNILLILGTTVMVQPMAVSDAVLYREIPVMLLFALLLYAVVANGMVVHRWEGAILLTAYAVFITWQVVTAR
jgi:cation:H+ antiporter